MADKVENKFNRRRFLAIAGATGVGLGLAATTPDNRVQAAGQATGHNALTGVLSADRKNVPLFNIIGVPDQVKASQMEKTANEKVPAVGDVAHENKVGLGTEHGIADPGNRTYSDLGVTIGPDGKKKWTEAQAQIDLQQESAGACWKTAEYRETFTHENFPFLIPEGGFVMITGAGLNINFPDGQSTADIQLGAMEGHTWVVLIRGLSRDYKPDVDRNVMLNAFNMVKPGAVNGTKLPPGQYVSEKYIMQNVRAAHGKDPAGPAIDCGTDGCSGVSFLYFELSDGAFTWINQPSPDADWKLVKTNIVA